MFFESFSSMDVFVYSSGYITVDKSQFRCALGRTGIKENKKEGDGATPAGKFPFRSVLFRSDRLSIPHTMLPTSSIQPEDGWCDEPYDPNYNKPVCIPYDASYEALWREDCLYDIIVVLGHNDEPVTPFCGSAIFLHCAKKNYSPTKGCVALSKRNLVSLLKLIGPEDNLIVSAEDSLS